MRSRRALPKRPETAPRSTGDRPSSSGLPRSQLDHGPTTVGLDPSVASRCSVQTPLIYTGGKTAIDGDASTGL